MSEQNKTPFPSSPSHLTGTWSNVVQFGFRLLYNEMAWTYDAVSWSVSLGAWRKWQLASLNYLKGPRVLELAHGPGHMLIELNRRGFQVFGLDLSYAMGRQARRRLVQAGLDHDVALIRCLIPDLPYRDHFFDGVLSQFPTDFILQPETIKQVNRILKSGGVFVILPEGHLTGRGPIKRLIEWAYVVTGQTAENGEETAKEEIQSVWHYFQNRLEAGGFEVKIENIAMDGSGATVVVATKLSY